MNMKIALVTLLSVSGIFCAEQQKAVSSLKDICFERCKDDLTEQEVSLTKTIKPVFQALQNNSHRQEMFQLLKDKKHPEVMEKIAHYTEHYRQNPFDNKGLNANNSDLLDLSCKKTAFGTYYTNLAKALPIQIEGDWQKTSFTASADGSIYLLTMPITGPDNYSSVNQFYAYKNTAVCNPAILSTKKLSKRPYCVKTELYRKQKDVYVNEPFYNPGGDKVYESKGKWLDNHELTNCLDTFPNNTLVITHTWGGIELHQGENVKQFIVPNSISAVSCSTNNKYIALGSYDGRVIVIDVSQTTAPRIEPIAHFKQYNEQYDQEEHPATIMECQFAETDPVTAVHCCADEKTVLFSSGKCLYSINIENAEQRKLFTDEATITSFAQVNNFVACVSEQETEHKIKQSTITLVDLNGKQEILSVTNQPLITSICPYITQTHNCLITGDVKGSVIIWNINKTDLTVNMMLQHDAPVHLVEVTKDKKHIVVKTTGDVKNQYGGTDKKDNVIFYPTPGALPQCAQQQSDEILSISQQFKDSHDNPQKLYSLLADNKNALYMQQHEDIIALKDAIESRIIECLKSEAFLATITDIYKLVELLNTFPSTNLNTPIKLSLSGMNEPEELNPLKRIDWEIKKTLQLAATPVLTQQLAKDPNHPTNQKNVCNVTSKLFWWHFWPNSDAPECPQLKALIDSVMPIYERLNKKEETTSWYTSASSFVSNNARVLIGATVAIPLAYLAFKYFTDNK